MRGTICCAGDRALIRDGRAGARAVNGRWGKLASQMQRKKAPGVQAAALQEVFRVQWRSAATPVSRAPIAERLETFGMLEMLGQRIRSRRPPDA